MTEGTRMVVPINVTWINELLHQAAMLSLLTYTGYWVLCSSNIIIMSWIVLAVLFKWVQTKVDDTQITLWLRSFTMSGISIVFFGMMLHPFRIWFGLLAFGVLALESFFRREYTTYMVFENWGNLGIAMFLIYLTKDLFSSVAVMLVIKTKMEMLLMRLIEMALELGIMYVLVRLLNWPGATLFGKRQLSTGRFFRYFMMGVVATLLSFYLTSFVLPWLFPSTVLLRAYNLVSWRAFDYVLNHAVVAVYILLQTLYEEVLFRVLLHRLWECCGYGEDIMHGKSRWFYQLLIVSVLMTAVFIAAHMYNPVENGLILQTVFEKFCGYFGVLCYSLTYLLTGNVAFGWGAHFANNYYISLYSYSSYPADLGFQQTNVMIDSLNPSKRIAQYVVNAVIKTGVLLAANAYITSDARSKR